MAELLISAVDKTHPDPKVNVRLFKKGDVVAAMPDGHKWGREERNPEKFMIIKVPALDIQEARRLCVPDFEPAAYNRFGAPGPNIHRARRFKIDETRLAPELLEQLREAKRLGKPLEASKDDILGLALIDKRKR